MFADYEPNRIAQKEAARQEVRTQLQQDQSRAVLEGLKAGLQYFGGSLGVAPFSDLIYKSLECSETYVEYLAGEALFHTRKIRWGWGEVVRLSFGLEPQSLGQGLRDSDIAEMLGISRPAVRAYRSRGLDSIRRELAAESRRREARLNYYAWQSAL